MDISRLVQTTLDNALSASLIKVHEGRRQEIATDSNPREYVVYTIAADSVETHANGSVIARTADIYVNYYINEAIAYKNEGKQQRKEAIGQIMSGMTAAGFECADGFSEVGDVDLAGFSTWGATFSYSREELY